MKALLLANTSALSVTNASPALPTQDRRHSAPAFCNRVLPLMSWRGHRIGNGNMAMSGIMHATHRTGSWSGEGSPLIAAIVTPTLLTAKVSAR